MCSIKRHRSLLRVCFFLAGELRFLLQNITLYGSSLHRSKVPVGEEVKIDGLAKPAIIHKNGMLIYGNDDKKVSRVWFWIRQAVDLLLLEIVTRILITNQNEEHSVIGFHRHVFNSIEIQTPKVIVKFFSDVPTHKT